MTDDEILHYIAQHGFVLAGEHPRWRAGVSRLVRGGRLTRVLPGTYVADSSVANLCAAVSAKYPAAVVVGAAAAALSYWPDCPVTTIDVAGRRGRAQGRYRFSEREVPADYIGIVNGIRLTLPALAAVDLASQSADAIDAAIRDSVVDQSGLADALAATPARVGNPIRRRRVRRSRTRPWSGGERELHDLFDLHRITGWRANVRIDGVVVDIVFGKERLVLEFEGHVFHSSAKQLHRDRERQNRLVAQGWRVVRVDWAMVTAEPDDFVRLVRTLLGNR